MQLLRCPRGGQACHPFYDNSWHWLACARHKPSLAAGLAGQLAGFCKNRPETFGLTGFPSRRGGVRVAHGGNICGSDRSQLLRLPVAIDGYVAADDPGSMSVNLVTREQSARRKCPINEPSECVTRWILPFCGRSNSPIRCETSSAIP